MALLFCDGFDHYATADMGKKWTTAGVSITIGAGGVNGTNAFSTFSDGGGYDAVKALPSNYATIVVGASVNPPASANFSTGWGFIEVRDAGTTQVRLYHAADGTISACRGSTVLGSSAAGALPSGIFSYVELKTTIDSTTGTVEVRVNGAAVITLTGQNTQATANAYVNQLKIASAANAGTTYFDNLYVCDTTGSTNNDFLGDIVVETIYPNAEGTNSAFTLSTGTTHYAVVDETAPNGDTDYAYSGTLNARETVNMGDITTVGSTVKAVALHAWVRKDGGDTRGVKPVVKSGATYSLGSEAVLGTGYTYASKIYDTDPNTSTAWTETTVNAIEAGVDVST